MKRIIICFRAIFNMLFRKTKSSLIILLVIMFVFLFLMDNSYVKFCSDAPERVSRTNAQRECLMENSENVFSDRFRVKDEVQTINESLPIYVKDKYNNPFFILELPSGEFFHNAPNPTLGHIWPDPYARIRNDISGQVHLVDTNTLTFKILPEKSDNECEIIESAIERYTSEIKNMAQFAKNVKCRNLHLKDSTNNLLGLASGSIKTVNLILSTPCDNNYPRQDMDESYEIEVLSSFAVIKANESWGLLRGMESFYQLLYISTIDTNVYINSTKIQDRPAHPHRGLLIDTARHFIPVQLIKLNLEAMAQNKMNVLHWHITDDQSFPFKSKQFPQFWQEGAYAIDKVYSHDDISDILYYAKLRGIRVIPEFDTPGHTSSWTKTAGIHLYCGVNSTGMLDITNPEVFHIAKIFFKEVRELFKDRAIHIGGDEVPTRCLYLNDKTRPYLSNYTHYELIENYILKLVDVLHEIDPEWQIIAWEEVYIKYKAQLNPNTTSIQSWRQMQSSLVASYNGYKVITSHCWYLDHLRETWEVFYDCSLLPPFTLKGGPIKYEGGEACMWTERVDETNIIQTIWPRAIATAERLWSYGNHTHLHGNVKSRFYEQNCRMQRRGIPVAPSSGAGNCD